MHAEGRPLDDLRIGVPDALVSPVEADQSDTLEKPSLCPIVPSSQGLAHVPSHGLDPVGVLGEVQAAPFDRAEAPPSRVRVRHGNDDLPLGLPPVQLGGHVFECLAQLFRHREVALHRVVPIGLRGRRAVLEGQQMPPFLAGEAQDQKAIEEEAVSRAERRTEVILAKPGGKR
jgi:hypothetical protein